MQGAWPLFELSFLKVAARDSQRSVFFGGGGTFSFEVPRMYGRTGTLFSVGKAGGGTPLLF